ncbi:MAG TPA: bifunctional oligoribonuclease/PAP phosphatase NrnA [Syntrophomonadaceae bacterium]|nr:bifunctional oligoribonuclease/PAP phosphatase NrnA [Syntrophomonadaceae bacterium]HNX28506.1 bifunctional oligoribonuclease/PAP phosphatase NrnA [Syntrophomonadaceae bacterium]HPR93060.1 bifunctional oligoribonuclease/PAP phosphatase NrnA [Syntrophomonadaceae bacterium]
MKVIKVSNKSREVIAGQLLARDNFLLLGHIIPDGDCIGSIAAMQLGLEVLGKKVEVVLLDQVPEIYNFLPVTARFRHEWPRDFKAENIIYLDCSDIMRVGEKIAAEINGEVTTFNIDHHATNDYFADYNWIEPGAAATAELVLALLNTMRVSISPDMATALYSGLVMDTGRFMYSNTSESTLSAAALLLKAGADIDQMRINLFESKTRAEVDLIRLALNNISLSDDGRIAWIALPYKRVQAIGALGIHPESIINYTREIKGVEVGMLFREIEPGMIKVGFRAKGKIDVAMIAGKIGGGGHRQAAGATYHGSLAQAKKVVIKMVRDVLD